MASLHTRISLPAALLALALLAGCGEWPDPVIPGASESGSAGWPTLVPIGPILARGEQPVAVLPPPAGRIAALNARAAALRGRSVIDSGTRARMRAGIDPAALAALN
ncbi:hypothetical protein [Flavimaricola marinus]|uniref:hypothetical protein n=1 Tax=Flavimaricola marinus TaxID=1819565 RepID=UPI0010548666|nr:hypothetical protein [Flavimaricola marinus]